MLEAINANQFLGWINLVENPPVPNSQLAPTGQILRHPHQPPMHHRFGVLRKPLNPTFDARADDGIKLGQLRVSPLAYFDSEGGHGK